MSAENAPQSAQEARPKNAPCHAGLGGSLALQGFADGFLPGFRYGSVCSGIEAASVAWHGLGWEPQFLSEYDAFPSAVLHARWGHVQNYGDLNEYKKWDTRSINLLVGGTPCQAFSVAGLRRGLADPRGQLTHTFLGLVEKSRPEWVLWENVPGVLSQDKGRIFGAILRTLEKLGYGWAYRVLDAQYFGVPQRRRRVFVVGCLGGMRRAAAVLFERTSLSGNIEEGRKAGKNSSGVFECGPAGCRESTVIPTLDARCKDGPIRNQVGACVVSAVTSKWSKGTGGPSENECQNLIAHTLRGEAFDASEDGCGRGTPLVSIASVHATQTPITSKDLLVPSPIGVRRLTPLECERLQGFPDDYTRLKSWQGYRDVGDDEDVQSLVDLGFNIRETKSGRLRVNDPDGPRYKALGNSMAVPVVYWIGKRISMVVEKWSQF